MQSLEPLSYFFGAYLGDGCSNWCGARRMVNVACSDLEIIERCDYDVSQYFNDLRAPRRYEKRLNSGKVLYIVQWNGKGFYDLILSAVGKKEIFPEYIWNASKEAKLDLLAGLMDTDGSMMYQRKGYYQCQFSGRSPFIDYFEDFCDSLGVETSSRIIRNKDTGRYGNKPVLSFYLHKESLIRSGFSFYVSRKQIKFWAWKNGVNHALHDY